MARYGKETTLPPRAVLRHAREFFGPGSELGLALTKDSLVEIGFAGRWGLFCTDWGIALRPPFVLIIQRKKAGNDRTQGR